MSKYLANLKDTKFKFDQTIIKKYSNGKNVTYKVVQCKCIRNAGIVDDDIIKFECEADELSEPAEKLENNICRTRSKIYELGYCNNWDWFFTGTLNKLKYDRTDLNKYHKDITQWIRDYNKKYDLSIKFLLIPELHKDGTNWHMHGLLYGLPVEHLTQFVEGMKMGKHIADKVKNGDIVYNWIDYHNKFGFCDLEPIKNHQAVCRYITKYISKSLSNSVKELHAHMYYCSRGLNRAELVKQGYMCGMNIQWDYSNDYCNIGWTDDVELINQIIEHM